MTFHIEFPDFPADEMPEVPASFDDVSWHNDACPSFVSDALGLQIFIDYKDPNQREFPETERFSVQSQDHGVEVSGPSLATDDWSEVLAFIAARTLELESTDAE